MTKEKEIEIAIEIIENNSELINLPKYAKIVSIFKPKKLVNWLKELKQLIEQTKWIPVSKRPPEDSGEYLVTVIDEDVESYKATGIARYAHPKDYDVRDGDWRGLMINEKVIAWMPLLKPYEPRESEE